MSILINHQEDKLSSTTNIIGSSNTGGFIIPNGNDNVDRPIASSQTNGLIRYNTTTNVMEAIINGLYTTIGSTLDVSIGGVLFGAINGLVLSTDGSTFGVSVGSATDSTNFLSIKNNTQFTACIIQSSGVWVAGNSSNKLDTGAKQNSTCYHVFIISNYNATAVDILLSLSASSPTLPSGYTRFRRIGSLFTDGSGNIIQFIQYGDEFYWKSPSLDVNVTNLSTTATLYTLPSVPLGIETKAIMNLVYASQTADTPIYISSPYTTDISPSLTVAPLATAITDETNKKNGQQIQCLTNTSAQIRARSGAANTTLELSVIGYIDHRGKN